MKNSVRHFVLVFAGIACVFALDSCAKNNVSKLEIHSLEPRCTRVVVGKFPEKQHEFLSDLYCVNGENILAAFVDHKFNDEVVYHRLNLKDLTISPYQFFTDNREVVFLEQFEKTTVLLTKTNNKYSISLIRSGATLNIPMPEMKIKKQNVIPFPYLEQNRLFVLKANKLLQWNILQGKAQKSPEEIELPWKQLDNSPFWIQNFDGERLWFNDQYDNEYSYDLKKHKGALVRESEYNKTMRSYRFVYDKHRRRWEWDGADLMCRFEGKEIAKYSLYDVSLIRNVFFDSDDKPMIWFKNGDIFKLLNGRWVALVKNLDFCQYSSTSSFSSAMVLQDGRIALIRGFDAEPRLMKVDDPSVAIVDLEKNEYEVLRFSQNY